MEKKNHNKTGKTRLQNVIRLSTKIKAYRLRMFGAVVCGIGRSTFHRRGLCCGSWSGGNGTRRDFVRTSTSSFSFVGSCGSRQSCFLLFGDVAGSRCAFRVLADFRIMLFDAIERVSPALLLNMRSGQLASTLMSDVELLEWFFAHSFGSILVATFVPMILMICLGCLSPICQESCSFFLILILWIPAWMRKKADRQGKIVRSS